MGEGERGGGKEAFSSVTGKQYMKPFLISTTCTKTEETNVFGSVDDGENTYSRVTNISDRIAVFKMVSGIFPQRKCFEILSPHNPDIDIF